MPWGGRRVLLLLVLVAFVFRPALADYWYEYYDRAQKAIAKQDWNGAIRELNQAIEKRSDPGTRVKTYGMNLIDYHPYLDLGLAYSRLGQYDAAIQALDVEERAGAIAQSKGGLEQLKGLRDAAVEAKRKASQTSEHDRIAAAVERSLDEIKTLEASGNVDGAIAAAGRGLAVDPNNATLQTAMTRLRGRAADAARSADADAQFARTVNLGKMYLSSGNYGGASTMFREAMAIKRTPELQSLLDESQAKLAEQIHPMGATASGKVQDDLDAAEQLATSERIPDALAKLQSVLALDPRNQRAIALQSRLITRQADLDAKRLRSDDVTKLLADGESLLRDGRGEDAAAVFNRVLALEPTNSSALASVGKAFALINKAILAGSGGVAVKTPPYILLSNTTLLQSSAVRTVAEGEEELREEHVGSPEVALNGMILDDLPDLRLTCRVSNGLTPDEALPFSPIPTTPIKQGDMFLYSFTHTVPLGPGVSNIQIAATGKDGAARLQVHRVRYIRPWFRSPWTFVIAGVAVTAGLGALRLRTIRRRNRKVRRRFNPYIAGAPVREDDMFLGREALLSQILQTIHNNSILLYGERRIGKTSLQHHLKKRLQQMQDPQFAFYPVFIDLQGTPQERFFWTLGHEMFHEIGPLLDGKLDGRGPKDGVEYPYETFVRDVRDILKVLRERTAKTVKVVLLIDEVDELNDYDPRINQKLRSLFMKNFAENLAAVVSGVGIKKQWESEGSPWYNFFEEIEVRPFSSKDAVELIEKPIRGIFTISPGVVDRIVQKTDCKPYLIQKICIALVNRLHEEGRRRITVDDVDAVGRAAEE